jgi:hydrogenase nickel incorporation protein HypB
MAARQIRIYQDLMGANDEWAAKTRTALRDRRLPMINIIGSPGCGKTYLLEKTIAALRPGLRVAVLEGDVATTRDAERLAKLDIPVSQLLTGGACHLEAKLVHHALLDLPLDAVDLVIVENVGNLVCPAEFDTGAHIRVMLLSIPEGHDKAAKYPLMFTVADCLLVTKTDYLPGSDFDLAALRDQARRLNPSLTIFEVSARTGDGVDDWCDWIVAAASRRPH